MTLSVSLRLHWERRALKWTLWAFPSISSESQSRWLYATISQVAVWRLAAGI